MLINRLSAWVRVLAYIVISFLAVVYILPYLWMIMSSLRPASEPFALGVFPHSWTAMNYISVLRDPQYMLGFGNSLEVAGLAGLLTMLLGIPAGYGFSRFNFPGKTWMMSFLMIIPTFPGILLAISFFVLAVKFKLYDTHVPLVLANTLINLPFCIWNLRTVFSASSRELEESAMVEGCNRLQSLIKIILPISLPGLASTFAFVFILSWNEYLFATTFISTQEKRLISTVMASAIGEFNVKYSLLIPAAILSTLPLIALFMIIQRYIISGLQSGGIKG